MRPRQLATESPLVEAYGATNIGVSLGRTVDAVMEQPALGGLVAKQFGIAGAQADAFTEDQREEFRQSEAERRRELYRLEYELDYTTDPVRREGIIKQMDDLYAQTNTQRSQIFEESKSQGRIMPEDAFKEQYGDLLQYTGPMTPAAAQMMYDNKKADVIRQAIINAGPKGIGPDVVKFGASVLNAATDPLELATAFLPVVGPAGRAAAAARFGRVGGAAAVGAVEGGVGSLLTEPLYYGLSESQQLDYSMREALFNVGAGVFLGGAIGTVIGAFARKGLNTDEIRRMVEPETNLIGGERVELPRVEAPSAEDLTVRDSLARERTRDLFDAVGGARTYGEAIRQLVNDQGVQVELIAPRSMPRPQSLSEFVRAKGGINDADPTFRGELEALGIKGRAQYTNNRGTQVNGLSNPNTKTNLDDMAALAQEAGFIERRDVNELVDALRRERNGEFVFSARYENDARRWREYYRAASDYDREVERRNDIRTELEEIGYRDVTEDEVALIAEYMSRNRSDVDTAAERVAIQAEGLRAQEISRRAQNPQYDPLADFEASRQVARAPEDEDFDAAIARDLDIVRQIAGDENASAADRRAAQEAIDSLDEIDRQTDAYIENLRAAVTCIVRN